MTAAFRYVRWDGSQDAELPHADEVLDAIADDALGDGDLLGALRRLLLPGRGDDASAVAQLRREIKRMRRVGDADLLQLLLRLLQDAGLVVQRDGRHDLTLAAIRRIGQRALSELFSRLRNYVGGQHEARRQGRDSERAEGSRPMAPGDPFDLALERSLFNALSRGGAGIPVRLSVNDFEIHRAERRAGCATALLIDTSRSMLLRGFALPAKKIAIALECLIRTRFPHDHLYLVGFADRARPLSLEQVAGLNYDASLAGTNLQDALVVARRLLARHQPLDRQIVVVTDGEPTAHLEGGALKLAYPPTFQTTRVTLREVVACTRAGILINTFMLDRSRYLVDFVNQVTRLNRGRVFFADPESLGDFVVVDYLANRRRKVA